MDVQDYLEHRRKKDHFFRTGENTPLGPGDHTAFEGLDYYEPDLGLVFTVPVEPGDGSEVRVATSDHREKVYTRYGVVVLDEPDDELDRAVLDAYLRLRRRRRV